MFGQSLVKTMQLQLIAKATGVITGHLQVQDARVKNVKFPEHPIRDAAAVEKALGAVAGRAGHQARILMTGLISSKKDSNGVLIVGVEPARDRELTTMHTYLSTGAFLSGRGGELFMGDSLAKTLGLKLGETAVLMAQASDGSMGADNFRITGLYHTGSQSFDNQIVYVPLSSMQEMLSMEGQANNFLLRLRDPERLDEARAVVERATAGLSVQVLRWKDIDYELVGIQTYQDAIMMMMLLIVFAIVSLGILNTLLMSTFERVREFGVLMAIGARPGRILKMIVLESCCLGAVGAAGGLAGGAALILWYGAHGLKLPVSDAVGYFLPFDTLLYLRFDWFRHATALSALLVVSVLAALPSALRASRLKPAECIRER